MFASIYLLLIFRKRDIDPFGPKQVACIKETLFYEEL